MGIITTFINNDQNTILHFKIFIYIRIVLLTLLIINAIYLYINYILLNHINTTVV
jgi:hypothetical protein